MKKAATTAAALLGAVEIFACTNVIITPGASADGSTMVSYAADSHWLFGELYFHPAADFPAGTTFDVREWDTNRPLGTIRQAEHCYQTMGNMNSCQLIIGETTWGGREEQMNPDGIMDYGSLIYLTLQRASSARAAIDTIVSLANRYGYPSEGETFSIADKNEAWIMDLVGKGREKGIVWVARRIPDGYICAHANQARITRFPLNDPDCLYAPDVISFARTMGWYSGSDEDFSFRDAYNPLDFGAARGCEARVWSAFNILCDGVFTYDDAGVERSRPAGDWLDFAMGYDLRGEMPLFVKPARKAGVKDVADVMRDHFEGTPMDMTADIGAGGNACPYRWRPMTFEVDGREYVNERAIATQQTGFWFVAQARKALPDMIGALIWFGCDDAATSWLTPCYVNASAVPECFREGNGDLLHYSAQSAFWINNRVTNACYRMYNQMAPIVRKAADEFELRQINEGVPATDAAALKALEKSRVISGSGNRRLGLKSHKGTFEARNIITDYTLSTAARQFADWTALEETLTVKFIDGNVKAQNPDGTFVHSEWSEGIPDGLEQPGYTDKWKEAVVRDAGSVLECK